jgi:hypothetical protein
MEMDKELQCESYQAIKELKEKEYIDRVLEARRMAPQDA